LCRQIDLCRAVLSIDASVKGQRRLAEFHIRFLDLDIGLIRVP
jgi:hypothetical protein